MTKFQVLLMTTIISLYFILLTGFTCVEAGGVKLNSLRQKRRNDDADDDVDSDAVVGLADPVIHDFNIMNFDINVGNGSTWLIKFYAPWCKRSKALHPILEQVSSYVNARPRLDVHVGRVNADHEVALGYRFFVEIDHMPYLYVITPEGRTHFYNSSSNVEEILDFITRDHKNTPSMHVASNPMSFWWAIIFSGPIAWLTEAYGHMEALFIVYLTIILLFAVLLVSCIWFTGEVCIYHSIERLKRRLKREASKKMRSGKMD